MVQHRAVLQLDAATPSSWCLLLNDHLPSLGAAQGFDGEDGDGDGDDSLKNADVKLHQLAAVMYFKWAWADLHDGAEPPSDMVRPRRPCRSLLFRGSAPLGKLMKARLAPYHPRRPRIASRCQRAVQGALPVL